MADENNRTEQLLAQLAFEWLQARTRGTPSLGAPSGPRVWAASVAQHGVAAAVEPVSSAPVPPSWPDRVESFAERIHAKGQGSAIVWVPAGADIPDREPAASGAADALSSALMVLQPGEVGEARLPIELSIRKRDEAGAYVSAFGGLSPHWARFTDRVQGYFQIDSTELHRLPADPAATTELVDRLVDASRSLALDETATVQAYDCWRVQRLRTGSGTGVVAIPPDDESESGAPLRRRLRQLLPAAGKRLGQAPADVRVLALYAHLPSLDGEPVGAALRGQDPTLFGGLDLVLLLADGQVRPLIDITRKLTLQPLSQSD